VVATLEELDREALLRILKEPKNALVRQYQKIFSFEEVELEFEEDALSEVADIAMKRKSGARGLRSVLESLMLDLMYNIPSKDNVRKVVINREMITGTEEPHIILREEEKSA
jgi:ATP-dependent Clp protease ATP-binding subunit ClpX